MKTQIIKIGNSKGIRIPKPLLEECKLENDVELKILADGLLIKPSDTPRKNWDEAFREMADNERDELLIDNGEAPSTFEKDKWRW